ncbi:MAG: hypothetical protein ACJ736_12350 [Streptomyces sp.]
MQHHQFDISDEDGPTGPSWSAGTTDWYGSVADGFTNVMTGIHAGDVDFALHETDPAPDNGAWQDIVEVSTRPTSGILRLGGGRSHPETPGGGLPALVVEASRQQQAVRRQGRLRSA